MSYFKERFNKRFLKNGIKALSFVLIIAVILLALSPVFMPKTNKGLKDKSAQGFLAEPDNSIDVVFVGDSLAYSSFIPLKYLMIMVYHRMYAVLRLRRSLIPKTL